VERIGKVVIGTVKGDIHDIGKNLVAMMLEGAGFEVIDLGINTPVEQYLEALEEHQPEILGMSALSRRRCPMKVVIHTAQREGPQRLHRARRRSALNEEFGTAIGRCVLPHAAVAAETAGARVGPRRGEGLAALDRTTELLESEVRRDRASRRAHPRVWRDRPQVLATIRLSRWTHVDVRCLPAGSTRPKDRRRRRRQADRAEGRYESVFVAYADVARAAHSC
jgi:hypothetical protein